MLKPQDYVILLKYLANPEQSWSQRDLSQMLNIGLSEVNAGIKRLSEAQLIRKDRDSNIIPIIPAAKEILIYGLKYQFPGKLGGFTRGIPTGAAAPLFKDKIAMGNDPVSIWPYARGEVQGVALDPIHPSIPKSLHDYPDENLYNLLALVDTIRIGRPRERNMAIKMLVERLEPCKPRAKN